MYEEACLGCLSLVALPFDSTLSLFGNTLGVTSVLGCMWGVSAVGSRSSATYLQACFWKHSEAQVSLSRVTLEDSG